MKKTLVCMLALAFAVISIGSTAFAGEAPSDGSVSEMREITIIPATDIQPEIGATLKEIIEVDGLSFKDLNANGELDPYEDWRLDTEERITDLYSQMTLDEKVALLYHPNTCGDPSGNDFHDERLLWAKEPYEDENAASSGGPGGSDSAASPAEEAEPAQEAAPAEEGGSSGDSNGGAPGGGSSMGNTKYSMWYYINVMGITHYLSNDNGTVEEMVYYHNAMQQMGEEARLGIPVTISCDRQYNAWGGMIDTAHDAFGVANDLPLAEKLWTLYSLETRAVGYHIVLHPYGVEIGSWNGEDPYYIGEMSFAEVNAIQVPNGTYACIKHFIGRGGDSDFAGARSVAQNTENWLYGWARALEANPRWLMLNGYNTGLSNTVHVDYDAQTMHYLRDTLGYDGVVLSDWGDQGDNNSSGVTADGIDLLSLSIPERYAFAINLGLDQMGNPGVTIETENTNTLSLQGTKDAVEQGLISEERLEEACRRILRTKFDMGLFENPYSDSEYALSLSASAEYIAQHWDIVDTQSLMAARNPEEVELERVLQAESAVLVKNDDNLLPLSHDAKVYFDSTASSATKQEILDAFTAAGTLVEDIEEAEVVIADCTQFNDAAELIIEDAKDFDKKLVIVSNCVDPSTYALEMGDAVLFMNFTRGADHGTGAEGFITTTEPVVYAELIYGDREPAGMIVKEIARDISMDGLQWKDLEGDQGASRYVRMLLLALMRENETHSVPNNYGDPLLCFRYGMRYGQEPAFRYDTLYLPTELIEITEETSSGASTRTQLSTAATAGEPFTAYVLLWNDGSDGVTTVQAYDGDELIGEKIMAVNGGSWRVVEMELTLDTPGEHTVTIGDLTGTMTIQ